MEGKGLLHVSVLGSLTVVRQSTRVQLPPSKKTRALLAYLAVTARPHSRDRLCTMFWNVPDDPRAALRWSLTRLRPLIDERDCRRIIADREHVRLDLTHANVDVLSLRNATRQGINSISTDALRQAVEVLDRDFLEGLDLPDCREFQGWCTAEREESRRLRVRLLTTLIARLEQVPADALPYARTLSLLEPANEAAQALLARVRAVGYASQAREQFQRGKRRVVEHRVVRMGVLQQPAQLPTGSDACTNRDANPFHRAFEERFARPALHEVRFCKTSDDVCIAYASVGDGPPIVWAAHWLSHLSFSWQSPVWRHWTQEFAKDHRFVHYDERGNGLSDWNNSDFTLEAFVRDLEAVVDALGIDRFALIGSSKGGPTSIAYAVRHPERVSHLVLYGTFAQGWQIQGTNLEQREAIIALIRNGWAQDNPAFRQILTSLFVPDATVEEMGWFNDLQRLAASAENAAGLLRAVGNFDVVDLLPGVAAPTLVLHCRHDAAVPFEQGRLIASRIPRARFIALEGRNHVLLPRDPSWASFVSEVRRFLHEGGRAAPSRRSGITADSSD